MNTISRTLILISLTIATVAQAGPNDAGGGQSVKLQDGSYRFLDMLEDNELGHIVEVNSGDIKGPRCVNNPIYKIENFSLDLKSIEQTLSKYPSFLYFFKKAAAGLQEKMYFTNVKKLLNLPDSKRIDEKLQINTGVFLNDIFLIYNPIFSKLPKKDQQAHFVHEILRNYAYTYDVDGSIELTDIEKASRSIVNGTHLDEVYELLNLKVIESIGSQFAALLKVQSIVKTISDSDKDVDLIKKMDAAVKILDSVLSQIPHSKIHDPRALNLIREATSNIDTFDIETVLERSELNDVALRNAFNQLLDRLSLGLAIFRTQSLEIGLGQSLRLDYKNFAISITYNNISKTASQETFDTQQLKWISKNNRVCRK